MNTYGLADTALDWAVGSTGEYGCGFFSTDWLAGGAIIEREGIEICPVGNGEWRAQLFGQGDLHRQYGDTPLVAAMRCYVASKLGDVVELPKALLEDLR